ncbi:hypothetical protein ACOSQ3_022271 [Xanthoceras sorbifolium]
MSSFGESFGSSWVVSSGPGWLVGEKACSTRSWRSTIAAVQCGAGRKQAAITATGEEATTTAMLSGAVRKQQLRRGRNNRSDLMRHSKEATDRSMRQSATTTTGEKR